MAHVSSMIHPLNIFKHEYFHSKRCEITREYQVIGTTKNTIEKRDVYH